MLRLLKPELADNPYAREIDSTLPRLLALADVDPLSPTRGFGDRQYWAWKLIDFPNGTLQGAVNGLSALLQMKAFSTRVSQAALEQRVIDMLLATPRMMRRDGSFEEALPYEQSYCVTALVAYDYFNALARLPEGLPLPPAAAIERAIAFLVSRDETHALISNHLATAVVALLRWDRLCGDRRARDKAETLLERILYRQSREGWFVEYGGADPGYQTLCMTHLADAAEMLDDERLWQALGRGIDFIAHFVQPDGSFGGVYGSRATRIYYPAAMEMLARRFKNAEKIAARMRRSVAEATTVPLTSIDQPNFLPVFNNYCQALLSADPALGGEDTWSPPAGRHWMPEAGLLVDIGETHHTVISTRKGGVVYHWRRSELATSDAGLVLDTGDGGYLTSQTGGAVTVELAEDRVRVVGRLTRRSLPLPNAFNFLVLRILALTVMRIPSIGGLIKSTIAGLLVHPRATQAGTYSREIVLGADLAVRDDWQPQHLKRRFLDQPFSTIHMASAGYWQLQDSLSTGDPSRSGSNGEAQ